ncbi:MAG: carbon starvation protein A [Bacteroidaceae bacterium]|nr:carbon starvation protein A [Bacteroidaceae bacterium]
MITFITSFLLLILGYIIYGRIVERNFRPDPDAKTPCYTLQDGVDYIPMPTWKVYLIQFLNIAGTGPIFGAILGILYGPAAYLWIVLGCIFGGAVHDYMCGMLSVRRGGVSIPEVVGDELGTTTRHLMRLITLILMVLVGAVFATTPADLLDRMIADDGFLWSKEFWIAIIFAYYFLATMLPIDKLIGRIYPVFGVALLAMAGGLAYGIFTCDGNIPEVTEAFQNHNPSSSIPLFPGLFITIACGAVSGFHSTQSPLMARCINNEKMGRRVFYGAMITEGLVALIWAAATIKFADSLGVEGDTPYDKLVAAMTNPETGKLSPAILVNAICHSWLGTVGAVLAILGVVAAPITSGDTAFRSARLIAADFTKMKQDYTYKRLILSLPIFAAAIVLVFINFDTLWRYFGWVNQTLTVFTLLAATVYLVRQHRTYWITLVPCLFMTLVCASYICVAPEGFSLPHTISYIIGVAAVLIAIIWFFLWKTKVNG